MKTSRITVFHAGPLIFPVLQFLCFFGEGSNAISGVGCVLQEQQPLRGAAPCTQLSTTRGEMAAEISLQCPILVERALLFIRRSARRLNYTHSPCGSIISSPVTAGFQSSLPICF